MIIRGQKYWTAKFHADIEVLRVAKNQSWADIMVKPVNGAKPWRKRQPLSAQGTFPFPVVEMSAK